MSLNPKSGNRRAKLLPAPIGGPEPPDEPPQAPGTTWDTHNVYPVWAGEEFEAQIYQREKRDAQTGQLVNFAVGLDVRPAGGDEAWVQVERVDVAHGFVHVDRYTRDGQQAKVTDIVPPECENDLDAALQWAIDYVWDVERRMARWG
jgi:hypothetical protein